MSHEPVALPVWQRFLVDHADGGVVTGTVVDVQPFGAFVELADGIHGLLHRSVWTIEPATGATVSVRIGNVDLAGRRVSLNPA
ncbi:MAG TPA: S1 RNA-binding domain-containing protein [Pseudonocardiaceae bacterium]|jgi:small subunit ribosomal protein S1|nr:S1 RNA-binding domain-containing protein [Pseudonocardiaceae bacterium]